MNVVIPVRVRDLKILAAIFLIPTALTLSIAMASRATWAWDVATLINVAPLIVMASLSVLVLFFSIKRNAIELKGDKFILRHSLYRITLSKSELRQARWSQCQSVGETGIHLRTLGTALPGYYSGYFRGRKQEKVFCAVSGFPVTCISYNQGKNALLVNLTEQGLEEIKAWLA